MPEHTQYKRNSFFPNVFVLWLFVFMNPELTDMEYIRILKYIQRKIFLDDQNLWFCSHCVLATAMASTPSPCLVGNCSETSGRKRGWTSIDLQNLKRPPKNPNGGWRGSGLDLGAKSNKGIAREYRVISGKRGPAQHAG